MREPGRSVAADQRQSGKGRFTGGDRTEDERGCGNRSGGMNCTRARIGVCREITRPKLGESHRVTLTGFAGVLLERPGHTTFGKEPFRAMKRISSVLLVATALALAACSGNSGSSNSTAQQTAASSAPAAAVNPTDFPLIDGATVVAEKPFTQKVDASMLSKSAAFSQGSGTYAGTQVISKTDKSLDDLSTWLVAQTAKPPAGYTAINSAQMATAHADAKKYGIDFAAFTKTDTKGIKHGLLLLALDPAGLDKKLGPAIGLINKYTSLPAMLRGPVDSQVKAKTGMSVTEMLDPGSPLGAALAAYDEVQGSNSRALVLVDASKQ